MPAEPGPFGWVANLSRWAKGDVRVGGSEGPLPPPRGFVTDPTDRDLYTGLIDGWMSSTVGASLSSFFSEPRSRKELYLLFERMDMTDMAGSVLDLYAEDATSVSSDKGKSLWFTGNPDLVAALDAMAKRLDLEHELMPLARETGKFGDSFNRLVYQSGIDGGVRRMLATPPLSVTRKEDKEARLLGYTQEGKKFKNGNSDTSHPWDFVHFRLRGRDRRYPYGTSLLHNGTRCWREWLVLSDWALGYQIGKHPDRNLFLLDMGSSSEGEKQEVGRKFATKLKKNLLIDPGGVSGRNGNTQSNPWTALEDLVMMVSSDSKTRIEKISGSGNALDIAPIKMLEQRFYAACRCPQSFFGYGDPQAEPLNYKASLTNQNIRYARTARRLQHTLKEGIRFISEMNLMLLMSPGDRLTEASQGLDLSVLDWRLTDNDFQVNMAPISFLDELERLEVMQTRMQVALAMSELTNGNPVVDTYNYTAYLLREVCQIPDDKIDELLRQDIENQHIDNMGAGLLPDGTNPHAKTESRRRMTAEERREARKADGTLTHKQKTLLSEAIEKNPALREALYTGRRLWENKESPVSHSGILPNNELIKQGYLKDSLTEEEVQQMLEEARTETGLNCALED